ncbi:Uncharacterized protein dnm_002010 [Desulfonema magnum]|uniref:Uncharacterized protein n=1 Tax=Desulfonema magnum TaxID=45655 RepID=A0A975GK37_9BACT|nr:Uncharacterized protein dnm_002010 [Desulfonema magnum]
MRKIASLYFRTPDARMRKTASLYFRTPDVLFLKFCYSI